ncbi:hypothetical protein PRIPAC_91720 [Pristionchus pacificus]|uniref:Uncharacterized protein n=1 Tax=Pristionchus pacificus TaxID=54126 RepID=A0A454XLW8_PRIPA|nr:hypothetical protein PRIPAC_91720 [Pristionchus pacificus]|eukprot:PDM68005.1 hypothetical protein PRIPAC_46049 [Pristionchus pacificus]
MLKLLILSVAVLVVVLAGTAQEDACEKEVKVKMNSETDFSLKLAVGMAMIFQKLGNKSAMKTTYIGLSKANQDRVRNYYLVGACLPFQSKLDE